VKLRFTPRAAANIGNIADYIRKRNPPAAKRVRASIYDSLHALSGVPEAQLRTVSFDLE